MSEFLAVPVFRHYPTIEEIAERLPVNCHDAAWMYWACCFGEPHVRLIRLNDLARAVLAGYPIFNPLAQQAALVTMMSPPLWERVR